MSAKKLNFLFLLSACVSVSNCPVVIMNRYFVCQHKGKNYYCCFYALCITFWRLGAGRILPTNVDTKIILFSYLKYSIEAICPPCVQTACYVLVPFCFFQLDTAFSPIIEPIKVVMKSKRKKVAGSLNTKIPIRTVPTAPIPVQTAYAVPIGNV